MKIKRYPQSCFMINTNNKKILVDPGKIAFKEEYKEEWFNADVILITHKHGDHCHNEILKEFKGKIYSSKEVKESYIDLDINVVEVGQKFNVEDIIIEVVDAKHGYLPRLKNGNEIFENIGFIINCESKRLYFTSDTLIFNNDYKCDILFAPISNHGLVMGIYEVSLYYKELKANLLIPCHMDNPLFPVDMKEFEKSMKDNDVNYKIMNIEESIEI